MNARDEAAREAARHLFADDNCEVDPDARVSHLEEEQTGVENWAWVQCWRLVPGEEIDRHVGDTAEGQNPGSIGGGPRG